MLRPLSQLNIKYTTKASMVKQPAQDRLLEFINNILKQQGCCECPIGGN